MTKLLQLKEWLTLPEAAKRLFVIFQEDVAETHFSDGRWTGVGTW